MSSDSKPRVRQNRHKQGLNQTREKLSADFRQLKKHGVEMTYPFSSMLLSNYLESNIEEKSVFRSGDHRIRLDDRRSLYPPAWSWHDALRRALEGGGEHQSSENGTQPQNGGSTSGNGGSSATPSDEPDYDQPSGD